MNFLKKLAYFVTHPTGSRTAGILLILLITASVPLTVFIAQKQQEIRQRAAGNECFLKTYNNVDCTGELQSSTPISGPAKSCVPAPFDETRGVESNSSYEVVCTTITPTPATKLQCSPPSSVVCSPNKEGYANFLITWIQRNAMFGKNYKIELCPDDPQASKDKCGYIANAETPATVTNLRSGEFLQLNKKYYARVQIESGLSDCATPGEWSEPVTCSLVGAPTSTPTPTPTSAPAAPPVTSKDSDKPCVKKSFVEGLKKKFTEGDTSVSLKELNSWAGAYTTSQNTCREQE